VLRSLPSDNLLVARNFDYTASLYDEESQIIKDKGFKESISSGDVNPSIQDRANVLLEVPLTHRHWEFDELVAFGACFTP